MANLSKMVMGRQRSSASVLAAGRTHIKPMAEKISEMYGNPELSSAVELIFDSLVTDLRTKTDTMVEADESHNTENMESAQAKMLRAQGDGPVTLWGYPKAKRTVREQTFHAQRRR